MSNLRRYLQLVPHDLVTPTVFLLLKLSSQSKLTYLMIVASEAQAEGVLTPQERARVVQIVNAMMDEIEKAA